MMAVGIIVRVTDFECAAIVPPPTVATVRFAVSEILATLLPRMAPETTAPAAIAGSTPRTDARPTIGTPIAPTVVSELPSMRLRSPASRKTVM